MKRFLLVSLSSVYCMLLCAANWYVATSGNDANDGHSWQTAKFTIDQAIRTASSGDSVLVAAGTYYQTFVLKDGVHVLGGYDANSGLRDIDANPTIIDGTNLNAPLLTTKAKFAVPTYVEGLVLQNAMHTSNGGAASLKTNAILNRCTIRNCYTDGSGGAVHNNGGTICNSVIELCESLGAGGAVHNLGGLVENTIIRGCKGNYAAIRNESDGVVRNCLLHNNEPSGSAWPNSGGIYNPSGVVYNNTLVCNYGSQYAGIHSDNIAYNNLLWNNHSEEGFADPATLSLEKIPSMALVTTQVIPSLKKRTSQLRFLPIIMVPTDLTSLHLPILLVRLRMRLRLQPCVLLILPSQLSRLLSTKPKRVPN